jgi:hypothetical protein
MLSPRIHRIADAPPGEEPAPRYSVCTLVTDPAQYEPLQASFRASGFDGASTEYLFIDNGQGQEACAYAGGNALLAAARGRYVILCHQDVRLIRDGRSALDACLADLDARDPAWAVAGNAGGIRPGALAIRISDPHGRDQRRGALPCRVASLDENFLLVRRAARIGFSRDLSGFHFYGADLCLAADVMGYSCYVIDFHLRHLSPGRKAADFYASEAAFRRKWGRALRARWVQTTCSLVRVSGLAADRAVGRLAQPLIETLSRRAARLLAPWAAALPRQGA